MDCRGCGTHIEGPPPIESINRAVDEILQSSLDDAVQRGGVCPLCGHTKERPFWNRKDLFVALAIACFVLVLVAFTRTHRHPTDEAPVAETAVSAALSKIRGNPEIIGILGTPIETGELKIGKTQIDETGWCEVKLSVPIHGPKGHATLRFVAGSANGTWTFSTLEVLTEEKAKPIDLTRGTLDLFEQPTFQSVHFQPAAAPELNAYSTVKPEWNGSTPYLNVSLSSFQPSLEQRKPSLLGQRSVNEASVNLAWGSFYLRQTDFFVDTGGDLPLDLTRTYQSWYPAPNAFGWGTNHPFDVCPYGSRNPYTFMFLILGDGTKVDFERISKGTGYADAVYRHSATSSEFYGAQIWWNGQGWTLKFDDGRQVLLPESYNGQSAAQGAPVEIRNARGDRIELIRDGQRNLRRVLSSSGHYVDFKYDNSNRVTEARDDRGTVRKYTYGLLNRHLATVSDETRVLYQFEYEFYRAGFNFVITAVRDGAGKEIVRNEYSDNARLIRQVFANGDVYEYLYRFNENRMIDQALVRFPNGTLQTVEILHPSRPVL